MKRAFCQALINGDLEIPCNKPPAEQIINAVVEPNIDKIIVIDDKVIIRGHLEIRIEYVACVSDESQPVHFVHFLVYFDCLIDYPCVKAGTEVKVYPEVEYKEFMLVDEKTISKFVVLKVTAEKEYDKLVHCYHNNFAFFAPFYVRKYAHYRSHKCK